MNKKQKQKLAKEFIEENGAVEFDFKERTLYFPDGGLFSIDEFPIMLHKIRGYKKLPNGMTQVLFTKKKYPNKITKSSIWFEELHDTILYLKRLEKLLIKMKYNPNAPFKKEFIEKLKPELKKI